MGFHGFWMVFDGFWWFLDGFWMGFDGFWMGFDGFLMVFGHSKRFYKSQANKNNHNEIRPPPPGSPHPQHPKTKHHDKSQAASLLSKLTHGGLGEVKAKQVDH